jgi:hypothetical protein
MAVRLSALHTGSPLTPGRFLLLITVRGWVDARAIVRLEGLGRWGFSDRGKNWLIRAHCRQKFSITSKWLFCRRNKLAWTRSRARSSKINIFLWLSLREEHLFVCIIFYYDALFGRNRVGQTDSGDYAYRYIECYIEKQLASCPTFSYPLFENVTYFWKL